MKNKLILLFIQLICFYSTEAQTLKDFPKELQSGIFERTIWNGETDREKMYLGNSLLAPHNEVYKLYFRFNFDTKEDKTEKFKIGSVFMSEMYPEILYRKKFRDIADFKNNKDGYHYLCKLYYDSLKSEYKINIYPNLPTNYCKGDMHWNKTHCLDSVRHINTLKYLISIQDYRYTDFIGTKNTKNAEMKLAEINTANKLTNAEQEKYLNALKNGYNATDWNNFIDYARNNINVEIPLTFSQKLRNKPYSDNITVNLNALKEIKCFSLKFQKYDIAPIETKDKQSDATANANVKYNIPPNGLTGFELAFTKYSESEDLIEKNHYTVDFIKNDIYSKFFKKDTVILTNPWLKNLIFSKVPTDKIIDGMIDFTKYNIPFAYDEDPINNVLIETKTSNFNSGLDKRIKDYDFRINFQTGIRDSLIIIEKYLTNFLIDNSQNLDINKIFSLKNYINKNDLKIKLEKELYTDNRTFLQYMIYSLFYPYITPNNFTNSLKLKYDTNFDKILKSMPSPEANVEAFKDLLKQIDSTLYDIHLTKEKLHERISILKKEREETEKQKNKSTNNYQPIFKTSLEVHPDSFYVYYGKYNENEKFDIKDIAHTNKVLRFLSESEYYLRDSIPKKQNDTTYTKGSIVGYHVNTVYDRNFFNSNFIKCINLHKGYEYLRFFSKDNYYEKRKLWYSKPKNLIVENEKDLNEILYAININENKLDSLINEKYEVRSTMKMLAIWHKNQENAIQENKNRLLMNPATKILIESILADSKKGNKKYWIKKRLRENIIKIKEEIDTTVSAIIEENKKLTIGQEFWKQRKLSIWSKYEISEIIDSFKIGNEKYVWLKVKKI